jgi:uncharacterized protein
MKDTLTFLVKSLVENTDAVSVEEENRDDILYLTITVDPSEMGKVIGKEGKIIRSIRNTMKIPAIKQGIRINVALKDSMPEKAA